MGGRWFVTLVACAFLASCASDSTKVPRSGGTPAREAGRPLLSELEELCAPVAKRYASLGKARTDRAFRRGARRLGKAETRLAAKLREFEAPGTFGDYLATYADELEKYSQAYAAQTDTSGPAGPALDRVVRSAQAGVRLGEAARGAGFPPGCPPFSDVESTLVVAKVNRDCWRLARGVRRKGLLEVPDTKEESLLVIDEWRRISAAIVEAARDATGPQGGRLFVKEVVGLEKRRLRLLGRLRGAIESVDFAAYQDVAAELLPLVKKVDRQLFAAGLVECPRAFNVTPL